ncbi:MAG: dihydroxyacetone kinase subunit L [Rhizobiaceae bacterium]|nr:dihydroxyacetone kinase subunit L [Rhizobiaceae bacterium]
MDSIGLGDAGSVALDIAAVIQANQARLGEIDGAIGDGDHGVNMGKGFRIAAERMRAAPQNLADGFETIGETLLGDIGGSMGPLYGTFFSEMAGSLKGESELTSAGFSRMLHAGVEAIVDLGGARPGDKSLVDVLIPARDAFDAALAGGKDFAGALSGMAAAAEAGLESTRGMVARIGRAARLGERSRGHLDAGAASCALILSTLAEGLRGKLG